MAADSLKIDFDSGLRPRIIDGVTGFHRYQAQIQETYQIPNPALPGTFIDAVRMIPNPESKGQFVKRIIAEQVMAWVVSFEESQDIAAVPRRTKPPIT